MADRRHIENRFLAIYRRHILRFMPNFGMEMKNHMQIWDSWPKWQFSQRMPMQVSIPRISILTKVEIFQIQDGGRTPYWKSFWLYFGALLAD